ncbi:MAG: hypothetical protein CL676_12590 [Bdellovibrionaceae bacterium]|nr:hypothetical protein [Pseudobdellovibrionaceae bacterium]|tara:strand:- start:6270 stop:7466 length:1197 start_codon:yes stop_codon:yes gene_type:complete
MKTFTKVALFLLLVSVCIQTYLTLKHYPLTLGLSTGPSICSINQTFDCDAVSASNYSTFLSIPISIWGAIVYLMTFGTLLLSWLQWTENPERMKRFAFFLSLVSTGASIVMGTIALTLMSNYCLFCMILYVFSVLVSLLIYLTLQEPFFSNFAKDIPLYFSENKGLLGVLIAIPVASFMIHRMMLSHYGASELENLVKRGVNSWQTEPQQSLSVPPLLTKGPPKDSATLVISEFADFLCGHCKHASHTLHAFVSAHPDVRFEFFVFPLDGACNPGVDRPNGRSCFLAKSVYCAEKQKQGWAFHDIIFQYQNQLYQSEGPEGLRADLDKLTQHLNYSREDLKACIDAVETQEAIEYQAQQGLSLKVQGTPTIFANGRILQMGQMIPVLEGVYSKSSKTK